MNTILVDNISHAFILNLKDVSQNKPFNIIQIGNNCVFLSGNHISYYLTIEK